MNLFLKIGLLGFTLMLLSCESSQPYQLQFTAKGDTIRIDPGKNWIKRGNIALSSKIDVASMVREYRGDTVCYEMWFYPNGIKMSEGGISRGIRNDTWKTYDSLGNLLMVYNILDGVASGPYVQYYPSGSLEIKGEDIQGNGVFEFYDSLGNLNEKFVYTDGTIVDTLFYKKSEN